MSNRLKPVPHAVWEAQQARIVLSAAKRLDWRRWPLPQQVEYLFSLYGPLPVVNAQLGENSALAPFYRYCIHEQKDANRNQCAGLLRGNKCPVRITQLRTYRSLLDEGRTLRHCVASYLESCRRGRSAIFSLILNGTRTVTLEVQANRTIVQARGLFNRRPNDEEANWIQRWNTDDRLLTPKHLLD